ncbi:MAG: DNA cytosine methyltransferase [Cyanobacteriota bacterium]|nr:DNA cytosine methyltransferase [Cyanobacteriota bacterium]
MTNFSIDKYEKTTISLFAGAGVGDKGLEAAGFRFLLHNEIEKNRAALIKTNFPNSRVIEGDILNGEQKIVEIVRDILGSQELFALIATPPCQGMSQNGLGTLLSNVRKGLRPKLDPRNRLILPALRIAAMLKPKWVICENVSRMSNTVIEDENGNFRQILDLIPEYLGTEYAGEAKVVDFADYGIPQRRKRLITVYSRSQFARDILKEGGSLIPAPTHDKLGKNNLQKWVTLKEAIGIFPELDAKTAKRAQHPSLPLHYVPVLDAEKYEWISHTPEGESAFNNQCINPDCCFDNNSKHGASRNYLGINRAKKDTPLYCLKCGSLLPRPFARNPDGSLRIMRGYTSAYKRMSWHLPAPTLTKNFSFPCSDNNIHPAQNRVLSLAEACQLHSISDFDYRWGPLVLKGKKIKQASDTLIREAIGESIPPKFMYLLGKHFLAISQGQVMPKQEEKPVQLELFSISNF